MGGRGGNILGAVVGSAGDCLNLEATAVEASEPILLAGKGKQGKAEACSNLHRDPHLLS